MQAKPDFPYWLVAVAFAGIAALAVALTDPTYQQILRALSKGVWITIYVTIVAFAGATVLGLLLALGSMSQWIILRQLTRGYIEVMRGLPILVLLLYIAFVLAPALVHGWNWLTAFFGADPVKVRDFSMLWRAVMALMLAYSAFIAEVFRAGLMAVETGQREAAKSLGLSRWHAFRFVVFPQALRTILPPLGNDFVAMVKDSSLVSILGVLDVAQIGKVTAAGNFRYFETYNMVALIYLTITITLSLILRRIETRLRNRPH